MTESVQQLLDLDGRVAVITGVASGIGQATARLLAAAGATIVGGDIDEARRARRPPKRSTATAGRRGSAAPT